MAPFPLPPRTDGQVRYFDPLIPPNKISFTGETTCDHCGAPASRWCCGACPVGDQTFYCGKECQKGDWRIHKSHCAHKQFYALTRLIQMPSEEGENILKEATERTGVHCPGWYRKFLQEAPLAARCISMLGTPAHSATLSAEVIAAIARLNNQSTPLDHKRRTGRLWILQNIAVSPEEVRFEDRLSQFDEKGLGGKVLPDGVRLFPRDYGEISVGFFARIFL